MNPQESSGFWKGRRNLSKSSFFGLLAPLILLRCATTGRFYPVQGPLSTQTPTPVLIAKVTGVLSSGTFSVTFRDGEQCTGHWSLVPRSNASAQTSEMSSVWDTVYGSGFYLSNVLGSKNYASAILTGARGTVINLEMYKPDRQERKNVPIRGVAKDNKGNIFKLVVG